MRTILSKYPCELFCVLALLMLSACTDRPGDSAVNTGKTALPDPDYTGITIPPNIAPLNFIVTEKGNKFHAEFTGTNGYSFTVSSKNGKIIIPPGKWKRLLSGNAGGETHISIFVKPKGGGWQKYDPIKWYIAEEPVDAYISYRLLYPGYQSWNELSIRQRSLSDYRERSVIENTVADDNCINCHSFNNGRTDDFLFHMRGSMGGTYFYNSGRLTRTNLKTKEMKNGAVYPRWHPSGKFVAFSSNNIVQQFHTADNKKIEVIDLESSLVLYDVEKNEMMNVDLIEKEKYMDTYPEWSPDGTYLYFCRAMQVAEDYDYRDIKYDLYRVRFDRETRTFRGEEMVFNASGMDKSVAFPRVSPDGRFLVLTLADYGCFPIWHSEADLWLIDLETMEASLLGLNSGFTDSYHSWSSDGRWLVFSSKRKDGLTARPYLARIGDDGKSDKPFVLPQKDPAFYDRFLKSYNIPEFTELKIGLTPGKIRRAASVTAAEAKWRGI